MKIKNNIYIVVAFFLAVALAMVSFVLYPAWQDINMGSNEIASEKSKTLLVDKQKIQLEDFEKNYETYKPRLQTVDQSFVNSKDPINFITFLENNAARASTSIEIRLSSLQEKSESGWPVSVYQVSVKGGFNSVVMFATQLETGPYLVRIKRLTLRQPQEDPTKPPSGNLIEGEFLVEVITSP